MAKLSLGLLGLILLMSYQQTTLAWTHFSRDIDEFHSSLYEKFVNSSLDKNVLFSPLGIELGLGMMRLAAKNTTAYEIDEVAKFSTRNPEQTAEGFKTILSEHVNDIEFANKIYMRRDCTPKDEYIDILTDKFNCTIESVELSDPTNAAVMINNWVNTKTNNRIKGNINADKFGPDLDIIIVNYVDLKSHWDSEFDKRFTTNRKFFLNHGTSIVVPMMKQKQTFKYAKMDDLGAQALRMDFKGSDLSMLILLPNKDSNLKNVVTKLRNIPMKNITSAMKPREVIVTLPKFQVAFEEELSPILKELGLNSIFSSNAELGNMLQENKKLKVNKILHKAVMTVHESGTETAAGGLIGDRDCREDCEPATFTANSPFYYAIIDSDNVVIFAGHLVNP